MKTTILFALTAFLCVSTHAQVKIGDNPTTIASSSLLELESTNKGLLLPRVNPSSVTNPVEGLLVFDNISKCVKVYDGSAWSDCLGKPGTTITDQIEANLGASQAAYLAAAAGTWVPITNGEYAALANNLQEITRTGSTESEYLGTLSGWNWGATTTANAGSPMPNGSYLFAFKVRSQPNVTVPAGCKVKISSTGPLNGYADLGNPLPAFQGYQSYFVLKGNTTATAAAGFMAFYTTDPTNLGHKTNGGAYYATTDAANLPSVTANSQVLVQGLSTTILQW